MSQTTTPTLSPEQARQLRAAATAQLARVDVAGFTAATSPDPKYRIAPWHNELGRKLDRLLDDVQAGREPRVILCAPPRHGKTEHVGRALGPCLMARMPGARVIYATHTQQPHADMVSLSARRTVEEHLSPHYPHLARSPESKWTTSLWETATTGWLAVGAGVGTSGMGAHLAVVDDPFGSAEDVRSKATRDRVWRWFLYDIESRIMGGGGIVVMHTRWHESDLVGRLLKHQPGQWEVLSWPAIAEQDEPGLRRRGEALVPHLYPLHRLERIRQRLNVQEGTRAWASLYQQRPVPEGGGTFQRSWFEQRYQGRPLDIARGCDEVVLSADAAVKGGASNDKHAIQVWGRKGAVGYLLARIAAPMDYPTFERRMDATYAEWREVLTGVVVEDTANGAVYIQRRRGQIPNLVPFSPTRDTPGKGSSKEDRAAYMVGPSEAGQVMLPEPDVAPWAEEWLDCICAFPHGANDDEVDAASQVWVRWAKRRHFDPAEWADFSAAV